MRPIDADALFAEFENVDWYNNADRDEIAERLVQTMGKGYMADRKRGRMMRNPCKECDYYHDENNTCQSKKCCTGGDGYITWIDRLFCKPYKYTADRKTEQNGKRGRVDDDSTMDNSGS